jgi:hypothetical protein
MVVFSFVKNRVGGGLGMAADLSKRFRVPEIAVPIPKWGLKRAAFFRYIVA